MSGQCVCGMCFDYSKVMGSYDGMRWVYCSREELVKFPYRVDHGSAQIPSEVGEIMAGFFN